MRVIICYKHLLGSISAARIYQVFHELLVLMVDRIGVNLG